MKHNIRILITLLALCLCFITLAGCAAKSPSGGYTDGEIGTGANENTGGSLWDDLFGGADKDAAMDAAPMAPDGSVEGDSYYGEMEEGVADGSIGSSSGGGSFEHQAGQLTGSEWNDNDHFAAFIEKINGQEKGWYEIAAKWNQVATKRIHVRVRNGETPVKLAKVLLYDANGQTIYAAVTDVNGDAYLFYDLNRSLAGQTPAQIKVVSQDGKTLTRQLEDGETEVAIELEAANGEIKLDLMFMIDTTGSMGDELEYLKAEMGDVIRRVASESNISVRTSVNFYRDEGDEYELRYFDFRENVDEVVNILAGQSASGGGDYEEAVDTALEYAIQQAKWDENSIKLVFLVLDAPPHYDADTVASIAASIKKAAEMGIRIIPVASSGVDTTCQVLFRTWAAMTGGTYTYLTNHSGIGGSHETPDVEEVNVELLNNMLVRIIREYVEGKPEEVEPLIRADGIVEIAISSLPEYEGYARRYTSADVVDH